MVRRSFIISKIKNTVPWTYVSSGLNGEKISGSFYEEKKPKKKKKKKIKKNSEEKKYLKEKVINCMSNGKDAIIHLIVGSLKKT